MRFIAFLLFGIWSIERSGNVYAAVHSSRAPLRATDHLLASLEIGIGKTSKSVSKGPLSPVSKVAKTGDTGEKLPFGIKRVLYNIREVPHEPQSPKLVGRRTVEKDPKPFETTVKKEISEEERIERVLLVKRALERKLQSGAADIEETIYMIASFVMKGWELSEEETFLLVKEAYFAYLREWVARKATTKTV
jgi:hypothetical protein